MTIVIVTLFLMWGFMFCYLLYSMANSNKNNNIINPNQKSGDETEKQIGYPYNDDNIC